jgi:hypothetical protein
MQLTGQPPLSAQEFEQRLRCVYICFCCSSRVADLLAQEYVWRTILAALNAAHQRFYAARPRLIYDPETGSWHHNICVAPISRFSSSYESTKTKSSQFAYFTF